MMSADPWGRLYRKDSIYRGLADELLVIAAVIRRAQQLAAALEPSVAHQHIRHLRLAEIQQAKDEFRALMDDLQVGAMSATVTRSPARLRPWAHERPESS